MALVVWDIALEAVRFGVARDVVPNITILVPFIASFSTEGLKDPAPMMHLQFPSLEAAQQFGNALLRHADSAEQVVCEGCPGAPEHDPHKWERDFTPEGEEREPEGPIGPFPEVPQ